MVQEVGQEIAAAVEDYLRQQGRTDLLQTLQWEFALVDSEEVNAWAMPGGKVAVYEGLLEVADTRAELAAVIGHEIAHVIAQHGAERVSQGLLTQLGVMLPYSRLQENEADRLGLIFMAMAGYDPRAALEVWQEMARRSEQPGVPAFLSTHPTDQQRIEQIRSVLPEALQYYRGT